MKPSSLRFLCACATVVSALSISHPACSQDSKPAILTPKSPATPQIHGAKVFGVRPGNPFLFTISATGDRPMEFFADGLPSGLSIDSKSGQITGVIKDKGESTVTLHAKNSLGEATRKLKIVCGDTIALTPPLGWNSWNCFASAVDDAKVRAAADAMVTSGLIQHGWTYINIDDCWEGDRGTDGMIQTNKKFPDMKGLGEYIHNKGLKFGIYSSPGPKTCAGFNGSYQFEDNDARRYGEWGVDYVKYDWCSYGGVSRNRKVERYVKLLPDQAEKITELSKEIEKLTALYKARTVEQTAQLKQSEDALAAILAKLGPSELKKIDLEILQEPYRVFRTSLDKVPRDIVYSFCQYGMGDVWKWGQELGGNCWRTTGDITDTWQSLKDIGFRQDGHEKFAGPGHWNDPDMLIVGHVGWGPKLHPSRLTPDEQYTHMTLWSLLAAPLLIGCDMTQLDEFTFSLLSNDEVIDVNQDPLGKPAGRVWKDGELEVWSRELEDGSKAVGLFNLGANETRIPVKWRDIGMSGKQIVRDLWRQKDVGAFENSFEAAVPSHGAVFIRLRPAN